MTKDYISKELSGFYRRFIVYGVIVVLSSVTLLFNSDLLLVPILITLVIVYLISQKIPEYLFWSKVQTMYKLNTLEDYVEVESDKIVNAKEYSKSIPKKETVTATRLNVQYKTEKDIYMSGTKYNKMKYLLTLKKLLDTDQHAENTDY